MHMETFPAHVERLRKAKGLSQARLINDAGTYTAKGLAPETIRNAVTGRRGVELPKLVVIEAIADTLDVDPSVFAIYRVQRAIARLDPGVVGLATATMNADLLLSQTTPTADETARDAARRQSAKTRSSKPGHPPSEATGRGS
jgi:transcriptional regulator with XRE-family HTH domain